MRIPRDKKKIHNLYENTAMREYLKRRLRTSNDDLTINRRIEKNWHWVAAEVPEPKEKKHGPNKGSRSKKKDLSLQTLFIYLTAFAIFKGYIFHKPFHHFFQIFFYLCSISLLLIHAFSLERIILRGQNWQQNFLIKACRATLNLLLWTTILQILVKG